MPLFRFDVIIKNQRTDETETISKEYFGCSWFDALDLVTEFVKELLEQRAKETGKYDWYLDSIKNYLS